MLKTNNYDLDAFTWVPVASVSFTIFIASWAILTLPFLVISEIMPEQIKDFGVTFCTFLVTVASFLTTKYFPIVSEMLGFHICWRRLLLRNLPYEIFTRDKRKKSRGDYEIIIVESKM